MVIWKHSKQRPHFLCEAAVSLCEREGGKEDLVHQGQGVVVEGGGGRVAKATVLLASLKEVS
jgi:hypothetical protein